MMAWTCYWAIGPTKWGCAKKEKERISERKSIKRKNLSLRQVFQSVRKIATFENNVRETCSLGGKGAM